MGREAAMAPHAHVVAPPDNVPFAPRAWLYPTSFTPRIRVYVLNVLLLLRTLVWARR